MTDEQSIRDALAATIHENFNACRGRNGVSPDALAAAILASPVVRRIQAEALREAVAADDFFAAYVDGESFKFNRGVTHGADSLFDQLRNRAGAIERGETA